MARRWGLGGPLVAALVLGGVLAGPAHARSKAGVSMAETMSVGGATLNLNGMAVRKKFILPATWASTSGCAKAATSSWQNRNRWLSDWSEAQSCRTGWA